MSDQEQKNPCDPDDVICEMEVLRHLKGLERELGSETFLEKYPEGAALRKRLPHEIIEQQRKVDHAVESCGEEPEEASEAASAAEEEEPAAGEEAPAAGSEFPPQPGEEEIPPPPGEDKD